MALILRYVPPFGEFVVSADHNTFPDRKERGGILLFSHFLPLNQSTTSPQNVLLMFRLVQTTTANLFQKFLKTFLDVCFYRNPESRFIEILPDP